LRPSRTGGKSPSRQIVNPICDLSGLAGSLVPVEIKAGKAASPDFFTGLRYWRSLAGVPADRSYVVYGGDDNQARERGNLVSWRKIASVLGD